MFAYNMFLRPTELELKDFDPEWTVVNAPGFMADPEVDGKFPPFPTLVVETSGTGSERNGLVPQSAGPFFAVFGAMCRIDPTSSRMCGASPTECSVHRFRR
jgi:hypothetical protein